MTMLFSSRWPMVVWYQGHLCPNMVYIMAKPSPEQNSKIKAPLRFSSRPGHQMITDRAPGLAPGGVPYWEGYYVPVFALDLDPPLRPVFFGRPYQEILPQQHSSQDHRNTQTSLSHQIIKLQLSIMPWVLTHNPNHHRCYF